MKLQTENDEEEVVLLLMENHVRKQEDELLIADITGLDQLVPSIGLRISCKLGVAGRPTLIR
jgi:hypothetical protein